MLLSSLLGFINSISRDLVSLGFVCFLALYSSYVLILKLLILVFRQRHNRKPFYCQMFRLYSKAHISNTPEQEKNFYVVSNKVTLFFNCMLVTCVLLFIIACFA